MITHSFHDCPYDDENACVDAWVAAHRKQLDRFTEEGLADPNAELPDAIYSTAAMPRPHPDQTVDGNR